MKWLTGDCFRRSILSAAFDVRVTAAAAPLIETAIARFGPVDVLVNNGGVGQIGAAEEIDDPHLRDMIVQHLLGPAALTRAVLPGMRARDLENPLERVHNKTSVLYRLS